MDGIVVGLVVDEEGAYFIGVEAGRDLSAAVEGRVEGLGVDGENDIGGERRGVIAILLQGVEQPILVGCELLD